MNGCGNGNGCSSWLIKFLGFNGICLIMFNPKFVATALGYLNIDVFMGTGDKGFKKNESLYF